MAGRLIKSVVGLLALLLIGAAAIGGYSFVRNAGLLSAFGIQSETHDSQVIQAIERTQQVSLLSLGIQGIREKDEKGHLLGLGVPGTTKKVFLQYNFKAKLGVDGAKVKVTKTGANAYRISVPKFIFIGYARPTFKVAVEDGGALGWVTPDIDKVQMVDEILNDGARQKYIDSNRDLLEDQTKVFYKSLITSVDPTASTTFQFKA
jgi:hypothetical protein